MSRFNQLDLEDLQFRATLSLIMSWMIKPNNKEKILINLLPLSGSQKSEKHGQNGYFMKLFQEGNLPICFQAFDQRYA